MSNIKTFRLLKREQPDRAKIEKVFAKKNDDVLLGALANPEHSEEPRTILQELAEQRGLQSGEERGWAQTEESMFVSPFGRKPTFDHFEQLAPIEPKGPRTPVSENLGVALVFAGPALWIFGGIFSWIRH